MPSPLLKTGLVFMWIGVVSFGGGLAVVPEMERELVHVHGWLTAREFADGYAIGQLAPGPNMLAVVFYGYKIAGVAGGLLAAALTIMPGALLATLCGRAWATLGGNKWIDRIRRGLVPVGFGLMTAGVFVLARATLMQWPHALLAAAVAMVVYRKWLNPAIAVLLSGVAGVLLGLAR